MDFNAISNYFSPNCRILSWFWKESWMHSNSINYCVYINPDLQLVTLQEAIILGGSLQIVHLLGLTLGLQFAPDAALASVAFSYYLYQRE